MLTCIFWRILRLASKVAARHRGSMKDFRAIHIAGIRISCCSEIQPPFQSLLSTAQLQIPAKLHIVLTTVCLTDSALRICQLAPGRRVGVKLRHNGVGCGAAEARRGAVIQPLARLARHALPPGKSRAAAAAANGRRLVAIERLSRQ
jgi:hypothetical protein